MSYMNISIPGGASKRLLTGGKYCPADIVVTAEGGGTTAPVSAKDVNFYDYDGQLLHSYTLTEAQALTELPPAPTPKREFLVFDGWNWTLDEVKAFGRKVDVGATYTTIDGATRLVVSVPHPTDLSVTLNFRGNATIDWGDGNTQSVTNGLYARNAIAHTYPGTGRYTIKLAYTQGQLYSLADEVNSIPIVGDAEQKSNGKLVEFYLGAMPLPFVDKLLGYSYGLELCTLNSSANVDNNVFFNCYRLRFFVYPKNTKSTGGSAFYGCESLSGCALNAKMAGTVNNNAFRFCRPLEKITIPDGVTGVATYVFQNSPLREVVIPKNVTTIGTGAFDAVKLETLILKPTTPPTLQAAGVFSGFRQDFAIFVPRGCLNAYQTATNWAAYASYMQEEPV